MPRGPSNDHSACDPRPVRWSRGWSEGLRTLGLRDVGIETDPAACATRAAAGHTTIRADVAAYPSAALRGKVSG
ncbi:hypothetical protein ID867_05945 [Streptomyces parvulus]|nr:hypothetical protein [Streptomyces parvulus]